MHTNSRVVGLSLCAALSLSTLTVPVASADADLDGGVVKVNRGHETGSAGYINGTVRPEGEAQLHYTHPDSALDPQDFTIDSLVQVNGQLFKYDSTAQPVITRDGETDVITYVQEGNGARVERSYRIVRNEVEVAVVVANIGQGAADVLIQSANEAGGGATPSSGNSHRLKSQGYALSYDFPDGLPFTNEVGLYANWSEKLEPGESLTSITRVGVITNEMALDTDGDGLRDEWEANGFALANGKRMPINNWGADPGQKDVFLQVNWMQSEWESLGCADVDRFDASVEGFTQFARCTTANKKNYAPDPSIFEEMEQLFARNGITLHIDAGSSYASPTLKMSKEERQGGKLVSKPGQRIAPYSAGYFDGEKSDWAKLDQQANELLGDRKNVFRSAVIGSRLNSSGNKMNVSGIAQTHGSAFFVAADPMSDRDQLRGTILHEFGHTLGLGHFGREIAENTVGQAIYGGYDFLGGYESAMSYAHQFGIFDLTSRTTNVTGELIPNPSDKRDVRPPAQYIDYTIPSDWGNLNLDNGIIGSGVLKQADEPQDAPGPKFAEEEDADVDQLALAAAATNNGRAGFRLIQENGIVARAGDNVVRGTLLNLGSEGDTFTLTANYGVGEFKKDFSLSGSEKVIQGSLVDIEIAPAALINRAVVPLKVAVTNSAGETVFRDTFQISVLGYTPEEAAKVLDEIMKSDASDEVKRFAQEKLKPLTETSEAPASPRPNPGSQKPSASTETTKANTGNGQTSGSSASPAAIGISVTLAVLALAGIGFGWALNQGLINLPF